MPRVAMKSQREDPFYSGPGLQYIIRLKIFGSGMPADRPTDNSELTFELDFDLGATAQEMLSLNRQRLRQAILTNVRAQGITIAENARIDDMSQFWQSV